MTAQANPLIDAIDLEAAEEAERERAAQAALDEENAVRNWLKRIEDARKADKPAREGYAKDRKYCRAKANSDVYDVQVPIAGTYVNILTTHLYARDPEPSVEPAEAVGQRIKEDAKAIASTLEIVVARLWKRGKLKHAADPFVRSGLSVGIGWFKAAWHKQTGTNPQTQQEIASLRENLAAIAAIQKTIADGEGADLGAQRAEMEQRLAQAEEQAARVLYNGQCIDFLRADDIQVALECPTLRDYVSSPWVAHRIFKLQATAQAEHPEAAEFLRSATLYFRVEGDQAAAGGFGAQGAEAEGDTYSKGAGGQQDASQGHVCIWEVWDKTTGHVITVAEGCNRYLQKPYQPAQRTTRFYPFFQWAVIWNDGERHPQSLTDRSRSLLDEYDRIRTNYRTHRRRAIPKTGFDRGALSVDDAKSLEGAVTQEMVGLDLQGQKPEQVVFPISYNQIDPALYDTTVIRQELEMIWGVQEALSSTIRVAKTATEADIQQQGTESRLGYARDSLDEVFTEYSQYTAEQATSPHGLSPEDVRNLAGAEALWVNLPDPEMLEMLVRVDIRAGSSGKPATALRQQQWGILLPQLQQAAVQIGELRGASKVDIANCLEQLAVETVKRSGDTSIDPYSFIPQAPALLPAVPGLPAMPGDPAALPPPAAPADALPVPAPAPLQSAIPA